MTKCNFTNYFKHNLAHIRQKINNYLFFFTVYCSAYLANILCMLQKEKKKIVDGL